MPHSYADNAFCPSQKETAKNVSEKLSAPKPFYAASGFLKMIQSKWQMLVTVKWPGRLL